MISDTTPWYRTSAEVISSTAFKFAY